MHVHDNRIRVISTCIIAFLSFCFIFPVFRSTIPFYSTFTDDFFYYLKIAGNFINGEGLSFTPGIFTNGYQPLYQALIIVLVYIAELLNASELVLSKIVLGIIFFLSSLWLQKKLHPTGPFQYLIFYLGLIHYYLISYTGMESILIVPLITTLFLDVARNRLSLAKMSMLVVLCFFVRIDSVIITIPLASYHFCIERMYERYPIKKLLMVALLSALPVLIYLLLNHFIFSSAFPISGVAKTVMKVSGIHFAGFESIYSYRPYNIFNIFICIIAVLSILQMNNPLRKYFFVLLIATVLFYLQNAIRSDWKLWSWYFYPIPVIAFIIACEPFRMAGKHNNSAVPLLPKLFALVTVVPVALGFLFILLYTFPLRFLNPRFEGKIDILHIAGFRIKSFEEKNRGVYAMGDRAGIAGYLIESPLIQLEGLVMDKQYMNHLKASTNLYELLSKYKVDFYIASNPVKLDDSTFVVSEPIQSNGYSKKITDTISWKVENQFLLAQPGLIIRNSYDAIETIIFRVPKK